MIASGLSVLGRFFIIWPFSEFINSYNMILVFTYYNESLFRFGIRMVKVVPSSGKEVTFKVPSR